MKRTGRRYRTGRADDHYDAIVIGSGIGGLCNAALLSKLGKKVCVLEQHYTAGGFTHSYEREGFEWDVGVHYIGEMQKPTMLKRLFDVISDGQLQWADDGPGLRPHHRRQPHRRFCRRQTEPGQFAEGPFPARSRRD
jgi:all-trans-retinol 13,14-reductase